MVDTYFPVVNRSVKSTDDPWITDEIRSVLKKKSVEYKKNGRSVLYYELRSKARELMAKGKKDYYDN